MKLSNQSKTVLKNQKPIDVDVYLKYRCPNPKCGQDKWINMIEASTKNFKIVCHCNTVVKPKLISNIEIIYDDTNIDKDKPKKLNTEEVIKAPQDILDKCKSVLGNYGFTDEESIELIHQSYNRNKSNDWKVILKQAIESIGVPNE